MKADTYFHFDVNTYLFKKMPISVFLGNILIDFLYFLILHTQVIRLDDLWLGKVEVARSACKFQKNVRVGLIVE